jgi:hypothetical protein
VIQATGSILPRIATTIKATDTIVMTKGMTIIIETINAPIILLQRQGQQEQKVLQEEG